MTTVETKAKLDREGRFCFACGTAADDASECKCGAPITAVERESSIIGSVYRLSGIRKKVGVVVADGEKVTLVTQPGRTVEVSRRRLDKSECVIDMSSVPSELFRLRSIGSRREEWSQGVAAWLQQSNLESWLSSWNSKRLYARSAIAAGRTDLVGESGLPESEIQWLEMHAAQAAGAHSEAVQAALALPPLAYPDKAGVVLSAVVCGSWEARPEELTQIEGWPRTSVQSLALRAALGLELELEEWEQVMEWLPSLSGVEDRDWMELIVAGVPGQALSARDMATVERIASDGESVTLPERTVAASFGVELSLGQQDVGVLASTAPSVLDDLN